MGITKTENDTKCGVCVMIKAHWSSWLEWDEGVEKRPFLQNYSHKTNVINSLLSFHGGEISCCIATKGKAIWNFRAFHPSLFLFHSIVLLPLSPNAETAEDLAMAFMHNKISSHIPPISLCSFSLAPHRILRPFSFHLIANISNMPPFLCATPSSNLPLISGQHEKKRETMHRVNFIIITLFPRTFSLSLHKRRVIYLFMGFQESLSHISPLTRTKSLAPPCRKSYLNPFSVHLPGVWISMGRAGEDKKETIPYKLRLLIPFHYHHLYDHDQILILSASVIA